MTALSVLTELGNIDPLKEEWSSTIAPGASGIYTSFAWCRAAWKNFPELGNPYVIAISSEGQIVAILPLTMSHGKLSWAGSPLGDKHDVRVKPNTSLDQSLPLIRKAVLHQSSQRISDVRAGTSLTRISHSYRGCPSPVLHLNRSDDEFGALSCLPGWSRRRRKSLRRARNGLHLLGDVRVERLTQPEQLATALPEFVKERITSWQQRGRISDLPEMDRHPAFTDFITEVGCTLAEDGKCFLSRICVDDDPVAQSIFFRTPSADLMYMTYYRSELARFSPSHLLLAEVAQHSTEEGKYLIETGRGDEGYKFDLGAEPHYLCELWFTDQD